MSENHGSYNWKDESKTQEETFHLILTKQELATLEPTQNTVIKVNKSVLAKVIKALSSEYQITIY